MSGYSALRARYCCIIGVWAGEGASSFIGRHCKSLLVSQRSVQLHLGIDLAAQHARERIERHAPEAVQREDVLAVAGHVDELRDPALDPGFLTGDETHQLPDGVVVAQRDQPAEVAGA